VDGELQGLTAARPHCLSELLVELYATSRELFAVALAAMTVNPAHALRIAPRAGSLRSGARADLVVFDPGAGGVCGVMGAGRWLRPPEPA
jgi:cytosine/adenosine deaminase-related metal-dependent hydrolase